MIAPTLPIHFSQPQLLHIIESIVLLGPITIEELKTHIRYSTGYSPEPDEVELIVACLVEKYCENFYGIAFTNRGGQLQFTSRSIKDIIK